MPFTVVYVWLSGHDTKTSDLKVTLNISIFFSHAGDKFYPYFTANDIYDDQFYSYNLGMLP